MGMIGCYIRMDDETVKELQNGAELDISGSDDNTLDIDKSWHAIHFVLSGEVWEIDEDNLLSQVVLGGSPVNDDDMGYGPARLLEKDLVKKLADALMSWDEKAFRHNFSMADMVENHVYPVMDDENEEQFFQYVWSNFKEVKTFFRQAADHGQNIISFIY